MADEVIVNGYGIKPQQNNNIFTLCNYLLHHVSMLANLGAKVNTQFQTSLGIIRLVSLEERWQGAFLIRLQSQMDIIPASTRKYIPL
jgi:hypothetical protein